MIINGDCIEEMKKLDDNSVDSIVTDPPYELGFMGKSWDSTGIAYNIDVWREALRVLKPGGHMLAFGGTRTYHRMACAIEDAGFEIRDMMQWLYGSGFPKSYDISKGIDKKLGKTREAIGSVKTRDLSRHNGEIKGDMLVGKYAGSAVVDITAPASTPAKQWDGWGTAVKPAHEDIVVATKPITVDDVFGEIFMEVCVWSQLLVYAAERNFKLNLRDSKEEPSIAQWLAEKNINTQDALNEAMDTLQSKTTMETIDLSTILSWKITLDEGYALMSRYTIRTKLETITTWTTSNSSLSQNTQSCTVNQEMSQSGKPASALTVQKSFNEEFTKLAIILPRFAQENATLKANEEGSAHNEPMVLARKPLSEKTVADNVMSWGTGGINIDDSRIPLNGEKQPSGSAKRIFKSNAYTTEKIYGDNKVTPLQGRFPANVLFDESAAAILDEQSGITKSDSHLRKSSHSNDNVYGNYHSFVNGGHDDSGGASRFFYVAKASKRERGEGNDHPTVKPLKLMEYLVTLVTPPNGVVLDPFAGSGTTGIAAKNKGFDFIGIERDAHYCEIARRRID